MSGINPFSLFAFFGGQSASAQLSSQSAQILSLPNALTNLSKAQQINGQVTSIQNDGTTIISTKQGDIAVKLPPSLPLTVGAKLDLQIPAGRDIATLQLKPDNRNNAAIIKTGANPQLNTSSDIVQTNTTKATRPQSDVQSLQQTKIQARVNIGQGIPAQTSANIINEGQTIRLSPLPATLQSTTGIQTLTQAIKVQQLNTHLSTLPPVARSINTSSAQPITIDQSLAKMTMNIRQVLSPSSLNYTVSGDRTPKPIAIMPPSLNTMTPSPSALSTRNEFVPTTLYSGNSVQSIQDKQIKTMVEPMHIRPPVVSKAAVSMSATLATMQAALPTQLMGMLNVFAGETVALSTGYFTEDGMPIVQLLSPASKAGFYSINYPSKNLGSGTFIIFKTLQTPSSLGVSSQLSDMDASFSSLLQSLPQPVAQSIMNVLPAPHNTTQFPVAALLFLAAATGGDLSGWLGHRNVRNLETATRNQLRDMLQDMLSSGKGRQANATDPQPVQSGDWRGHQIPLVSHDGGLSAAMLWVKDDPTHTSEGKNAKDTATRFLLDLHLTRMGPVHFDGLVHAKRQKLDLAFSTQRKLAEPMEDKLRTLWFNTLDGLGYTGSLTFKTLRQAT